MTDSGAIAVFVKTPGLSPVKTRLANSIGAKAAGRFYELCVAATEAVLLRACSETSLTGYWAVAEPEALEASRWSDLTVIPQGSGGLGERLDRVYRALLDRHSFVVLIGADAPLLSSAILVAAADVMLSQRVVFAISRAGDGGYGLFAGRVEIPSTLWNGIPYSASNTADVFIAKLQELGNVVALAGVDDVDVFDDLNTLCHSAEGWSLLPEQVAVVDYAKHLIEHLLR